MKLQNLAIIFIVIMIPIILVASYYFSLQKSTLSLQTSYDQKLVEATKEAMTAYEINTTEWNSTYSNLSDSRRRNITASINTFISSLGNHLGLSNTAKEDLLSYIPAIAFTLYDGYYVYSPAYTPVVKTNSDGIGQYDEETGELLYQTETGETTDVNKAKYEYKHTLTTYLPYGELYEVKNTYKDYIIIDYTLDNYIKIYGILDGEVIEKAGNLIYFGTNSDMALNTTNPTVKYLGKEIKPETLTEYIIYYIDNNGAKQEVKSTYNYIYDIQNEKYYWDASKNNFFRIIEGERKDLSPCTVGDFSAKYRKISIVRGSQKIEIYELLNPEGEEREFYCDKDGDGNLDTKIIENGTETVSSWPVSEIYREVKGVEKTKDCSAINYYIDSYAFTKWVENNLARKEGFEFLKVSNENNPEEENSLFATERRKVIKKVVQDSLNTSITQYAKETTGYDYKVIQLSESDWDKILRNISMITFFEGVPIGLKYYNSYAIATSTTNNEYINKDEIYFTVVGDNDYHSVYTNENISGTVKGYRNTDYIRKKYETDDETKYYYLHNELACYDCIVGNNNKTSQINTNLIDEYYSALARERYVQNKTVQYVNGDLKENIKIKYVIYKLNGGMQDWSFPLTVEKPDDISIEIEGKATKDNTNGFVYWHGEYKINEEQKSAQFIDGDIYNINASLDLTASYKVHIEYDGNGREGAPGIVEGIDEGNGFTTTIASMASYEEGSYRYEFLGWSKDKNSEMAEYTDEITIRENTKLYAIWKKTDIPATLTYDANGGTGAPATQESTAGSTIQISSTKPTRERYEFLGWAETKDSVAGETLYNAGDNITISGDKTLYARWKKATVKFVITIEGNNHYFIVEKDGVKSEKLTHYELDLGTLNWWNYFKSNTFIVRINDGCNDEANCDKEELLVAKAVYGDKIVWAEAYRWHGRDHDVDDLKSIYIYTADAVDCYGWYYSLGDNRLNIYSDNNGKSWEISYPSEIEPYPY